MSTPDIIEEKVAEYLRLVLNPDLSGPEPDPIEDMKTWLRNTLTDIYQHGREDEKQTVLNLISPANLNGMLTTGNCVHGSIHGLCGKCAQDTLLKIETYLS